jgi:hypothetical protein
MSSMSVTTRPTWTSSKSLTQTVSRNHHSLSKPRWKTLAPLLLAAMMFATYPLPLISVPAFAKQEQRVNWSTLFLPNSNGLPTIAVLLHQVESENAEEKEGEKEEDKEREEEEEKEGDQLEE